MSILFEDSWGRPIDPDIVELHFGGAIYTYADNQITRDDVGKYTYESFAGSPGSYKRIWKGKNLDESYDIESIPRNIVVNSSQI